MVTARKKYGIQGEYETRYNESDDDIEIYQYKNVVDDVRDPILEISLSDAKELDEESEVGDQLGIRIENPNFTRVDVQTARQIIFQKVRDAERENFLLITNIEKVNLSQELQDDTREEISLLD